MPIPDLSKDDVDTLVHCQRIHKSIIGDTEQLSSADLANSTIALINRLKSWRKPAASFGRYDAAVQDLICAVIFEAKEELAHPRRRKELNSYQINALANWQGPYRSRG